MIAVAFLNIAPGNLQTPVAVIFPPWTDASDAMSRVAAADVSLVSMGRLPFIVIVQPTGTAYAAELQSRGALMIVDARAGGGCLTAAEQPG